MTGRREPHASGLAAPADDGLVLADVDPKDVRRVHLVGIAGTGMGALAGMLKAAGYEVTDPRTGATREQGREHEQGLHVGYALG